MITLSDRLRLIAEMVPFNAEVCDVGTDHGYLSAFLIASKRARSVIATDIREKPLKNAEKNLKKLGITEVSLRLCNGLSAVFENEADTVIIAGMGGEVISGIIERTAWLQKKGKTLILQAMTSSEYLREYLAKNAFAIKREETVFENGKIYSVILSEYDGKTREITPQYKYIGAIKGKSQTDFVYVRKQYERLKKCAQELSEVKDLKERYHEYNNAALALKQFLDTLPQTTEETNGV